MIKVEKSSLRISPKRTVEKVRVLTTSDLLYPDSIRGDDSFAPAIHELVVNGLLSFAEETRFEFGRLNILVGPNGSGKSNLLDCIRVFRHTPFDVQDVFRDSGFEDWIYKGRDAKSETAFLQITATIADHEERIRHQMRLGPSIRSRAPLEESISKVGPKGSDTEFYFVGGYHGNATLYTQSSGARKRERALSDKEYDAYQSILSQIRDAGQYPEITGLANLFSSLRIYSEWSFGRNSTLREATPSSRSSVTLSESMDDLALVLNGLEKTSAHDQIRILLKDLKETYVDFVTRILFGRVGLELYEKPYDTSIPAKRLSDGTLRFLALAAILLQPDPPPLICLEEPELGMHPDMIRMVARMLVDAASKTQIIVSTHSEHLLSALQNDFDVLFASRPASTSSSPASARRWAAASRSSSPTGRSGSSGSRSARVAPAAR